MKKIILLRHADASENQKDDKIRSISQIGENQIEILRKNFERIELNDNTHTLISTAERTQRTFNAIKDFPSVKKVFIEEKLYLACKHTLLRKVQAQPSDVDNIVIIGHNPGLSDLISYLTFSDHYCETASITTLETDITTWVNCDAHEEFKVTYIPTIIN